MRIDSCITAIDKESQFTKSTAVADEFVDISMSHRISCTLESEICRMSVKACFYCCCQSFNSFVILETYALRCTHLFRKFKTLCISVNCSNVFNTHGSQNCDTDQTNRSASLYNYTAVKAKNTCGFCSFYSMDKYCARLNQNTGIQIQITYIKYCGSAAYQDIIREPSIQMNIIIRKKSIYISTTYVLFIQIIHSDVRVIFKDHTGNYLITDLQIFSCRIFLHIFTHFNDFTGSFMSKSYRNQSKRVSFKFMSICTAYTTAFYSYQNIIIANFRHWIFFYIKVFQSCQHSHMCCFRNTSACCRSRSCCRCCRSLSGHSCQYLFHDLFNIDIICVHFLSSRSTNA